MWECLKDLRKVGGRGGGRILLMNVKKGTDWYP